MDKDTYQKATETRLSELLDVIEAGWGFRPPVSVNVETVLKVSADFDIVGFAHKGRSFLVHDKNVHRRGPRAIANAIAQEIVSHRNTCNECGTGTMPIWRRLARLQYPTYYSQENVAEALTPADAVERVVFPRQAKALDRLIAARAKIVADPAMA